MYFPLKLVTAALALALLAGTAAAQTELADQEIAKVRSELAATQKALTETRQALEKCQMDQAAAQAKLAETIKAGETLRKKLETENAQLVASATALELANKEAARINAEIVAAQKLTDAKLGKTQAELTAAQKTLAETKQTLNKKQAELAQADMARETLAKEVAAEKAQSLAAAIQHDLAAKEADKAKAELVASQKALFEAKDAKTQKDLAASEKALAEIRTAADDLRKKLESEIKVSTAKVATANQKADSLQMQLKTAATKLELAAKEDAKTKTELSSAQKTLALQPPLPCTIVVTLPADAQVTFDDRATTSTGDHRVFISPPLSVGKSFWYLLKANVMRDGKVVTMQKLIEVRAGERIEISLTLPDAASIGQP